MINPLWLIGRRRRLRNRVRCLLITLDGAGAGALPDAAGFGDEGANTLGHVAEAVGGLRLPNLGAMGLGNIIPLDGVPPVPRPQAMFGRLSELSRGKDTTAGHWELMGAVTEKPFPLFPNGFPDEVIERFQEATGRGVLGNRPASGTEIIAELGQEHLRTGKLIVYTSTDSVFQIAAHEDVASVEELYGYCRQAREILRGPYEVVRVIARPFTGEPGGFVRTRDRRDFSVMPPRTYLNLLAELKVPVHGVGKISQIFAGSGVTREHKTSSNADGIQRSLELMAELDEGLVFTNLVDFDMLWGHRNDPEGYARGLEEFDAAVPQLIACCRPGDLLIITADHGCDPLHPGTDHTREYVPLLARMGGDIYSPGGSLFDTGAVGEGGNDERQPRNRPFLGRMSDVGATVMKLFTSGKLELAEAMSMPGRPFLTVSRGE